VIKVQLVKSEGCVHCEQVKAILEKLKPEFPDLEVEEVLMTTEKGMELIQKYVIMSSPGVIINGQLAFTGGGSEEQVRKALASA
jgi:glutaredoxin